MSVGSDESLGYQQLQTTPEAWAPELSEACARELMEAVPPVMRFIRAEMRRHLGARISVPQFRALALIERVPGTSLSDVAEHLGVTRPTASALVDRLVRRGLVGRVQHPQERRRVALSLTRAGRALLERARAHTRASVARKLAELSSAELGRLAEGLAVLRAVFEAGEGRLAR